MSEFDAISKEFLTQYYTTIMQNRNQLINFYNDNSWMTYGGQTFRGVKEISEKIESFGFGFFGILKLLYIWSIICFDMPPNFAP